MRQLNLFGKPYIANKIVPSIPYMGSKRQIATKILNSIYKTVGDFTTFYDLFGGGGAVSVAGLIAGHKVHYNEKNRGVAELMRYIKNGGGIPLRWVPRSEFFDKKNGDDWKAGLIKTCWSFGNNQKGYLFSKEIEEIKKAAHDYLIENGYKGNCLKRLELLRKFKRDKNIKGRFELQQLERLEQLQQLERLEQLQQLERLEQLQQLERLEQLQQLQQLEQLQQLQQLEQLQQLQQLEQLEQLEITSKDYRAVQITPDSVVYCDPPYKNTGKYQEGIDHDIFYVWCLNQNNPVFISGYDMPPEFEEVGSYAHRCTLSPNSNNKTTEKLYWNRKCIKHPIIK